MIENAASDRDVPLDIFIVSDATGSTAEAVVTSVLVQFGDASARVRRYPFTRSVEQVERIIGAAPEAGGIVVFSFVSSELSAAMVEMGRAKGLLIIDLLSPLMNAVADTLNYVPSRTPGALRSTTADQFEVTEDIHYTLQHDDGNGLATLDRADLIILGVSRTAKTPTSIYLACRKLKVANIPIIRGIPLPEEVTRSRVPKVGFLMELERQVQIRSERAVRMGTTIPGYAERAHVFAEMEYCERVFRGIPGLSTLDVTNRSIEEISDWVTHNVL